MKTFFAGLLGAIIGIAFVLLVPVSNLFMNHSGMDMGAPKDATTATLAFIEANNVMHKDMSITYSGNADIDFARGMIPHHQGAIDMAKIVLEHGTDPEIKKLAEGVVAAQDSEITFMQGWLAKNDK